MPEINIPKQIDIGIGKISSRVIKFCLILAGISAFAAVLMGSSTITIQEEIRNNRNFIDTAKEMRPNFEDSLSLYTGDTQKVVDYLLALRPATEEEFITFISRLENLGQELSLNLSIKNIENLGYNNGKPIKASSNMIGYHVSFYGSIRDLKSFIRSLDALPYYIEVSDIKYSNPAFQEDDESATGQQIANTEKNISIMLRLFTKSRNAV